MMNSPSTLLRREQGTPPPELRLRRWRGSILALSLAVAASSSCIAGVSSGLNSPGGSDGSDGSGSGGGPGGGSTRGAGALPVDHIPPTQACTQTGTPAPRALRRLTALEFNSTLADLFGKDPMAPKSSTVFVGDPVIYGFLAMAQSLSVSATDAATLQSLSEAAATLAASKPTLVTSCSTADDACRKTTVEGFGARAFRRPLTSAESTAYQTLMSQGKDFGQQLQILVSAMLQSPHFLYRAELGGQAQNGSFTLTPYEIASEISYLTIGSMPDAALTQAAADGSLQQASVQRAQATRLLADPRAHVVVDNFYLQWLNLTALPAATRMEGNDMLDQATRLDMVEEARRLVDSMAFDPKATFASLFATDHTFVNDNLVKFYGLTGGGGDFTAAPVGSRAKGVLGLGGVLAAQSSTSTASPTLRGRMVRMRLMCDPLGSPPPGVPAIDTSTPGQTLRQRFSAHATNASCASCHKLMDPLGFTMGGYDTMGRQRPGGMEAGQPVDVSGNMLVTADGTDTPLPSGVDDLSTFLGGSTQAQACMVHHMVLYTLGQLSWNQDACTFDAAAKTAAAANYNLLQSYLAVMDTSSFSQRVMDL